MDHFSQTSSIRLAAVDESNLDIAMQFVGQFYEHFQYPFEQNRKRALLAEFMADESLGRLWIIEQAGVPVGYTIVAFSFSLERNGRVAFIDELFITSSARSAGVGATVLAEIEVWCASIGVTTLRLEAEASNERATALYMRCGYVDQHRRLLTKIHSGQHH